MFAVPGHLQVAGGADGDALRLRRHRQAQHSTRGAGITCICPR
jgi:hypothetical protein